MTYLLYYHSFPGDCWVFCMWYNVTWRTYYTIIHFLEIVESMLFLILSRRHASFFYVVSYTTCYKTSARTRDTVPINPRVDARLPSVPANRPCFRNHGRIRGTGNERCHRGVACDTSESWHSWTAFRILSMCSCCLDPGWKWRREWWREVDVDVGSVFFSGNIIR